MHILLLPKEPVSGASVSLSWCETPQNEARSFPVYELMWWVMMAPSSSSEQGWRYGESLCRTIKNHHFVWKNQCVLAKSGAAGLCFPVLFLLGSGHIARGFPCHWAGVAEPLWTLWNVGQCGIYLSVLNHSTAGSPYKPVFTLWLQLSLPWQKTPRVWLDTVLAPWFSQLEWLLGEAGCIWPWHTFRKQWHSYPCRILMYAHKRLNISTSFFNLDDNSFAKVKLNWLTHTLCSQGI